MNLIGNIIWVVFGGLFLSLGYLFGGLVLCLTIVGIPFGLKVMRLGLFALWPFGSTGRQANGLSFAAAQRTLDRIWRY